MANSIDVSLSDSPAVDVNFGQSGFKFYLKSLVEDTLSLVSEDETRALEIKVRRWRGGWVGGEQGRWVGRFVGAWMRASKSVAQFFANQYDDNLCHP